MSSLPASIKRIESKTTEKRWRHHKSMVAFCCHGNQSFVQSAPKPNAAFPPPQWCYSTANENHNEIDVRSTFTIQSYVRIDRFGIDYQSVIDQSNQFIHLPIVQSFKSFILLLFKLSIHSFHKNTKSKNGRNSQKCTKFLMRFIYSIYLFNKCHNFIYFDSSDWYVLGDNKFYFSCKTITEKKSSVNNEPRHKKTNEMTFALSEDSDQPGHPPSLISLRCALSG